MGATSLVFYFSPCSLNAVCQPISLLSIYDGSSRTFGSRLILDGWQWSRFWC